MFKKICVDFFMKALLFWSFVDVQAINQAINEKYGNSFNVERIILLNHQDDSGQEEQFKVFTDYYKSFTPYYDTYAWMSPSINDHGFANSVGYVEYFKETLKLKISEIYATGPNVLVGGAYDLPPNFRARQYIRPWATMLTLFNNLKYFSTPALEQDEINTSFTADAFCGTVDPSCDSITPEQQAQFDLMFKQIKSKKNDVVVCWDHPSIFWIAKTFGAVNPDVLKILKGWPTTEYNWIWILNYESGNLVTIDQYLYDPADPAKKTLLQTYINES